jgi:transcriptional regulator with XRE-family HTH domain
LRRSPAEIRQALGDAIRQLRTERRFTQEELADRAGVHAHYVSDIERGIRNVAIINLTYLADAFELSAAELLGVAGL